MGISLPIFVYLFFVVSVHHSTPIHFIVFGGIWMGSLLSPQIRDFVKLAVPILLYAILYDLFPLIPHQYWGEVIIQGLHDAESLIFKVQLATYFLHHNHFILDFITGIFYGLHFWTFVAFALYLWKCFPRRYFIQFGWAFFLANFGWMVTVFLWPMAPPWYVHQFGFELTSLNLIGDAAGLLRFDTLVGTHFFQNLYAKSRIVFGAMPSMHAGWPILMLLSAWQIHNRKLFGVLIGYTICMWFSALYLQHHYLLDLLGGLLYAVIAWLTVRKLNTKS